jgi:hypothetical protein
MYKELIIPLHSIHVNNLLGLGNLLYTLTAGLFAKNNISATTVHQEQSGHVGSKGEIFAKSH